MLCQICKQREATVHYTRIVNQKKVGMYVCGQCAGENDEIKVNIHKFLSGIMGIDTVNNIEDTPITIKKCASCGMTIEEFNKTGMLGCTKCYEAFGDSIQTMLKRIHGNARHQGKIPHKLSGKINEEKNLRHLREELQQCIQREDYEKAAQLRDEIRAMGKSTEHEKG